MPTEDYSSIVCQCLGYSTFAVEQEGARLGEPWSLVEQVAAHLEVVQDSICRWIKARHSPAPKFGRRWKFKRSEVDNWVRAGGAESGEKPASNTKTTTRGRS